MYEKNVFHSPGVQAYDRPKFKGIINFFGWAFPVVYFFDLLDPFRILPITLLIELFLVIFRIYKANSKNQFNSWLAISLPVKIAAIPCTRFYLTNLFFIFDESDF